MEILSGQGDSRQPRPARCSRSNSSTVEECIQSTAPRQACRLHRRSCLPTLPTTPPPSSPPPTDNDGELFRTDAILDEQSYLNGQLLATAHVRRRTVGWIYDDSRGMSRGECPWPDLFQERYLPRGAIRHAGQQPQFQLTIIRHGHVIPQRGNERLPNLEASHFCIDVERAAGQVRVDQNGIGGRHHIRI